MAITNGYATQTELVSYIASANNQALIATDNRGTELDAAISTVSRAIDQFCGRVFWDAGSATARVFRADRTSVIDVDEFSTAAGLVIATDTGGDGTFDTTWTASDYQLEPLNGIRDGRTGWPYRTVRAVAGLSFPVDWQGQARVQITAQWGWAAVPDEVHQACLIWAHRLLRRSESPEGVAGFGDFGAVRLTSVDRDVETLLTPFRLTATLVA